MRSIGLHKFNLSKATLVRKTNTIPEASDKDKLAEFGQNPAEFDDNDDIILLYLEMCLLHSQLVQLNWCLKKNDTAYFFSDAGAPGPRKVHQDT